MTVRELTYGNFFGDQTSAHIDQQNGSDPVIHYSEKNPETKMNFYAHRGYDTPKYHEKLKNGELLPYTDWRQELVTGQIEKANWTIASSSYNFSQWSHGLLGPVWIDAELDWMRVRSYTDADLEERVGISYEKLGRDAVQEAAAKIYSDGFDGLTFIAELHKVNKLFKRFVQKFRKLTPDELTKWWLEGRYGWRIMLFDIEEINELITKIDGDRTRYKKRSGESGTYKDVKLFTTEAGPGVFVYSHVDEIAWSIRGSIVADIQPPDVAINPIATAWELITFSFVIDWIIDIGRWLEAMSFLLLQSDYSAARGLQFTWNTVTEVNSFTPTDIYSTGTVTYRAECRKVFTRRLPTSVSKLPSFGLNLNVLKLIDIIALIRRFIASR